MNPTAADFQKALPDGGLFAGKTWLASPEAFPLTSAQGAELEKLGHRLHVFLKA